MTIEQQIERASKPQVGDAYAGGKYGANRSARVVLVGADYVRCFSMPTGVEFDTPATDWSRICANTIRNGATFTPAEVPQ